MLSKITFITIIAVVVGRAQNGGYQLPQPQPQQSYQQPQQQQQSYQQPQQFNQDPSNSRNSFSQPQQSYGGDQKEEGMPFNFAYAVQDEYSGNDFSHSSDSDGEVTKGEYRVLLPDGRTQIVTYTADHENGYQAEVTYEGEARPYEPQQNSNQGYQKQSSQQQQSYQQPQASRPSNNYGTPF